MAKVSGQLKDASINGKPRDLMNMIFDISPTDTPFLTACGKSSASQTLHEWQTDILNAPVKNAQLEGDDAKNFEASNTTELTNKTQILSKNISVSGTAQAVKQAGVSKQYNYQLAQRMKEIKKDLELALLSNQIEGNDNGTSQGRTMRGLPCWMTETSNISLGASGAAATSSAVATVGTARAFTEELLKTVLTGIYTSGGNPDRIMVAPDLRVKMSEICL